MNGTEIAKRAVTLTPDHLFIISICLIAFMAIALIGVLLIIYNRSGKVTLKDGAEEIKHSRVARRAIQLLAVALVLPTIALLALHDLISPAVSGTLFGTFIGYVLSGLGDDKKEANAKAAARP